MVWPPNQVSKCIPFGYCFGKIVTPSDDKGSGDKKPAPKPDTSGGTKPQNNKEQGTGSVDSEKADSSSSNSDKKSDTASTQPASKPAEISKDSGTPAKSDTAQSKAGK